MTRTVRPMILVLLAVAAVGAVAALAVSTSAPTSAPAMTLPPPATTGHMSLEEALATRRSVRHFQSTPLTPKQIGQLCWAAQGVTEPKRGLRTAPSAMAKYPLELYVVTAEGARHYVPATHALEPCQGGDLRATLGRQRTVAEAPAVFVFTAVPSRMGGRFPQRTQRWIDLEVGHDAQNLLLQAVALGLGAVPVGGYDEAAVAQALQLPEGQQVCYLVPVGTPAGSGP